ncbi:hypothetical protein AB0B89_12960 [Sphaerisporangium sp. NPDC049002]|uniref:hypothetical protein n=1 Tax=unclassified Sphaerisporangium TaxID=2630420 RepID=UPI003401E6D1
MSGVPRLDPDNVDDEPVLWTWDADDLGGRGVRGVTDTSVRARRALLAALHTMPDRGRGTVRPARLDLFAYPYPCYRYGPILVRANRDHASGAIVFHHGEERCG